ncbi:hypothetical protein [Actinomadura sp. 7K507]|uniref:hypothetical protein n=1 Tax=Actinomadura sp. 7K507 TaxID=2530365 RepID=UPI001053EC80|nr:hypothetical protein [Actinomadura sp. 7K507]TDC85585.1 hypothetical protein E1285_24850 [Actinomadura sp. 7K507]
MVEATLISEADPAAGNRSVRWWVVYEIARMAGFYAAHGVWSVSDGEALIPFLGYAQVDGKQGMQRLVGDDALRSAQDAFGAGRDDWVRAVLVVDAYLHLDTGRTDALIVDAADYGPARRTVKMAVPYRPGAAPQGFAVYRPKFMEVVGVDDPDYAALADAFFAGVDSHERAAAVWNAHLVDESV